MWIKTIMVVGILAVTTSAFAEDVVVSSETKKEFRSVSTPRATEYVGMEIYDPSEKKIGVISNIVINGGEHRVSYAVVSYSGSDKVYAVPWTVLKFKSDQPKRVYIKEETFKTAPAFDKGALPDNDTAFQKEVDSYYEKKSEHSSRSADGSTEHSAEKVTVKSDGGIKSTEKSAEWTRRGTFVFGSPVKSSDDQTVGEVQDLVMDSDGQVKYVVIASEGKMYGVPFAVIHSKPDVKEFTVEVSKDTFKSAPTFDKSWSDWHDEKYRSTVDTYYKKTIKN